MKARILLISLLLFTQLVGAGTLNESFTDPVGDVDYVIQDRSGEFTTSDLVLDIFKSVDITSANYSFDTGTGGVRASITTPEAVNLTGVENLESLVFAFDASNSYNCGINTCSSTTLHMEIDFVTNTSTFTFNYDEITGEVSLEGSVVTFETTAEGAAELFTQTRSAQYTYLFTTTGIFLNESIFSDELQQQQDVTGEGILSLFPGVSALLLVVIVTVRRRKGMDVNFV